MAEPSVSSPFNVYMVFLYEELLFIPKIHSCWDPVIAKQLFIAKQLCYIQTTELYSNKNV